MHARQMELDTGQVANRNKHNLSVMCGRAGLHVLWPRCTVGMGLAALHRDVQLLMFHLRVMLYLRRNF